MNKSHCIAGVNVTIPIIFAFLPISIAYAAIACEAGFSAVEMVLISASVFAGSTLIMATGMYVHLSTKTPMLRSTIADIRNSEAYPLFSGKPLYPIYSYLRESSVQLPRISLYSCALYQYLYLI